MHTLMFRVLAMMAILGVSHSPATHAEDIDIFKAGGSQDPAPPNVLLIIDNTSNWSASNQKWNKADVLAKCGTDTVCQGYVNQIFTGSSLKQGEVEAAALKLVLNELTSSCATPATLNINIGLMLINGSAFSDDGINTTTGGADSWSGYIRKAVLPMTGSNCTNLLADLESIENDLKPWEVSSSANYGGVLFDAFKYYGGYTSPANVGSPGSPLSHVAFGPKRFGCYNKLEDYRNGFISPCESAPGDCPKVLPTCSRSYQSPITEPAPNSCGGQNYILLVGNGFPNPDSATALTHLNYSTAPICCASMSGGARLGDVWTKFLANTDVSPIAGVQRVRTFTMNIFNASQDANQTILLKSMATTGNGSYYEVDGNLSTLINSFKNFFTSINAANQSFAPAALPTSLGSNLNLNQVYLGMFRPDKNPRWVGNLKQYQFALYGTNADGTPNIYLTDSSAQSPPKKIHGSTGFISDDAISFWTQASTFWSYRCGSPLAEPLLCGVPVSSSDSPDGAVVEKGGAAQSVRGTISADISETSRTIYTDNGTSRIDFNTTNVTTQLDPAGMTLTSAERAAIVNWARGFDNTKEKDAGNGPRPSIIGDVLHSEPVAVNYGTTAGGCSSSATGDVVVFYAGNDGHLHAVNGGKNEGAELWSFIPSVFLNRLKRLRDNAPAVTFPAPVPANEFNKPYLIDGSLTVHAPDADGNCKPDKVWLFVTMRRGGRFLYALDVTNRANPSLLWKMSQTDTGFSELGQTWSRLTPIALPGGKTGLVFGAGYDPDAEDKPFNMVTGTYGSPKNNSRAMGRGVFVLTLSAGGQIAHTKFFTAGGYSIPSDVAVVNDTATGYAERAFVGDTGGNLWRIIFRDPMTSAITDDSDQWTMTQMATLERIFLYPPDVARCGGTDAILIGSGDREKPFERDAETLNRFFMIQDGATGITTSELTDVTSPGATPDLAQKGWYLNLARGEKVVGGAVTQFGTTYFPTNLAADNSGAECTTGLGTSRIYGVACDTGGPSVYAPDANGNPTSRFKDMPGGGFPPSPTPVVIKLTDGNTGETKTVQTAVTRTEFTPGKEVSSKRRFSYWYRRGLD